MTNVFSEFLPIHLASIHVGVVVVDVTGLVGFTENRQSNLRCNSVGVVNN